MFSVPFTHFPFGWRKGSVWVMGKNYGAKDEDLFRVLSSKGKKSTGSHLLLLMKWNASNDRFNNVQLVLQIHLPNLRNQKETSSLCSWSASHLWQTHQSLFRHLVFMQGNVQRTELNWQPFIHYWRLWNGYDLSERQFQPLCQVLVGGCLRTSTKI